MKGGTWRGGELCAAYAAKRKEKNVGLTGGAPLPPSPRHTFFRGPQAVRSKPITSLLTTLITHPPHARHAVLSQPAPSPQPPHTHHHAITVHQPWRSPHPRQPARDRVAVLRVLPPHVHWGGVGCSREVGVGGSLGTRERSTQCTCVPAPLPHAFRASSRSLHDPQHRQHVGHTLQPPCHVGVGRRVGAMLCGGSTHSRPRLASGLQLHTRCINQGSPGGQRWVGNGGGGRVGRGRGRWRACWWPRRGGKEGGGRRFCRRGYC